MRLTSLQISLWAAVAVALAGYVALVWRAGAPDSGTAVTIEQSFRPEFRLTDATGRAVSNSDFAGRFQLVGTSKNCA